MKLTAIFLFIACLHVTARTAAQTVTLSLKNAPMKQVFKEIQKQTGLAILVEESVLDKAGKVTLQVHDMPVDAVLTLCLKNEPLNFTIKGGAIIVKPKPTPALQSGVTSPSDLLKDFFPPPPIDIHGRVTDPEGNPLVGANIKVKSTNIGAVTDGDGRFTLKGIDDNATIEISFVGFVTQTILVNKRTSILLQLKRNESPLDEIQIGAYSKTTKRFQVGNVTTIKSDVIEKQPVTNVLQALENQVPGLNIIQTNGLNGGGITVRIQGQSSLRYGSDPLYVVDGVPIVSQLPSTGPDNVLGGSGSLQAGAPNFQFYGNPLNYLNPNDIESVEVLKDADATSIYGSQAAAGAILITTKKGKAGPPKISLNFQEGFSKVPKMLDFLNTPEYLSMRNEGLKNDGFIASSSSTASAPYKYAPDLTIWDTTRYTDWQKTLIGGAAQFINLNASVSGGTNNVQYLLSATYNKQTTVFPGDFNDQKGSLHFSLNTNSADRKLKFAFTASYMVDINKLPPVDLTKYIVLPPNTPSPFNSDGTLNWSPNSAGSSTWDNPYKILDPYSLYKNNTANLITNVVLSYHLAKGLDIKSSIGYTDMQTQDFWTQPLALTPPESQNVNSRQSYFGNRQINSYIIEPQITYNRKISIGKLNFLIGATFRDNRTLGSKISGTGYSSDLLLQNLSSATSYSATSLSLDQKYAGLYGQINYQLEDRFILNLSGRRDGSSRFGPDNRYHNFWSLGGAWLFNEESLVKKMIPFLSFGKLKASYGTTGSDQIGDYTYLNLYNSFGVAFPYQGIGALSPGGLVNLALGWEETHKFSIGLDLGFLHDRILVNITYSKNQSSNELRNDPISTVTGFTTINENFPATIRNVDWEFSLSSTNIKTKDFIWKTNFNYTIPHNKLIFFGGISTPTAGNSFTLGEGLDVAYLYHYLGVDPQTGLYLMADKSGNPTKSASSITDRTVLRSKYPSFHAGISNSFSYKAFSLDILFSLLNQYAPNNSFSVTGGVAPGFYSFSINSPWGNILEQTYLNTWHKPGDVATFQKFSAVGTLSNNVSTSDVAMSNAFFARLKNLSLSYKLPLAWKQKLHVADCKIYAQGQNLLTITGFKGLDPETVSITGLPPMKTFTLGLQVGF